MAVLFDRIMTTKSGYEAFLRDDVNNALMRVLNQWGKYLQTPASASVLNDGPDGWLSPNAFAVMESVTKQPYNTTKSFQELFQCDPSAAHYGFSSWDDFFTRRFRPGIRPVAQGDDVIAAACESHPYNIQHDIKLSDEFYIKGQPYSVINMLDGDELSPKFAGGTVFQGLLTGASYHRWHAPVSGVIRRAKVKQGTYFSIPSFQSQCPRPSPAFDGKCIIESQAYLSSMATRAIIIIEADNKDLGLVAFIAVGMTEVSTCDIGIKQGQHVQKGDELGVFRFGGSSHCLMFQKDVKLTDWPDLNDPGDVAVRGALARVLPK
ncbi:hypothetical protein Golomagni_07597 [Golovinomyces magnicellulatus]|nr:hypothetical protein Golomagni_07597 [Golovinomyces magnicellulatus]